MCLDLGYGLNNLSFPIFCRSFLFQIEMHINGIAEIPRAFVTCWVNKRSRKWTLLVKYMMEHMLDITWVN